MKVKFSLETKFICSGVSEIIEIDEEDVEGMTEVEISEYIDEMFQEWVWENIIANWKTIEEE